MFLLKLGLWLSAWGGWAWIGRELHCELPHRIPPAIGRVELEKNTAVYGFFCDSHEVVVRQLLPEGTYNRISIFDARSGARLRVFDGPPWLYHHGIADVTSEARGLALVNAGHGQDGKPEYGPLHVIHLASGKWQKVSNNHGEYLVAHSTRPWVLYQEGKEGRSGPRPRVVVYDFNREREVFSLVTPRGLEFAEPAFFAGSSDRVVVPIRRYGDGSSPNKPTELELWTVGDAPKRVAVGRLSHFGRDPAATDAGLVKFTSGFETVKLEVFDLIADRMVFSRALEFEEPPPRRSTPWTRAALSSDGRRLLGGPRPRLWDLATGAVLWEGRIDERAELERSGKRFRVHESAWLFGFERPRAWQTVAVRDIETGKMAYRLWSRAADASWVQSADGTLTVDSYSGYVRPMTPGVDWAALVMCQSLLALPLACSWTIHRLMCG